MWHSSAQLFIIFLVFLLQQIFFLCHLNDLIDDVALAAVKMCRHTHTTHTTDRKVTYRVRLPSLKTSVSVHHETKLRLKVQSNSKMCYLNVQLLGLSGHGHPHPALMDIFTTQDVKKLGLYIKLLAGDFLTAEREASNQPQLHPICSVSVESISHVLVQFRPLSKVRERLLPELLNVQCTALLRHPERPFSTRPRSVHT